MPQTLEPMMGGKEGLEVAGSFGERERERERERDFKHESYCGSDKYRGVRKRANVQCFTKILCKIFYVNLLRLICLTKNTLLLTKYFTAKQTL